MRVVVVAAVSPTMNSRTVVVAAAVEGCTEGAPLPMQAGPGAVLGTCLLHSSINLAATRARRGQNLLRKTY